MTVSMSSTDPVEMKLQEPDCFISMEISLLEAFHILQTQQCI